MHISVTHVDIGGQ